MGLGLSRTLIVKSASVAFSIGLIVTISSAQRPKVLAPHEPIARRVPKDKELPLPPAKLGSVVGGPWMVDANFKSSIYIRNVVETQSVSVTPILYLSNGIKYSLPQVKLEPAGTAIVDVNAALESLGLASYATLSGYVELQYNFPWHPICAFIRNVDTVHSMIFLQSMQVLPTELLVDASSQPATKQQVLEGMWWKQEPNVTGFVTLSNTSHRPITATLQTSDSTGNPFVTHNLTISANGTKVVQVNELTSASQNEGGIRVTYRGPQDALIVNGGLEDASVGYSANMHFLGAQANPRVSPLSVVELGLMTGVADPMMSFPAGTKFTPYSLLRNTSSVPAVVTPTVWWMQSGAAQSFQLPPMTLQAYQTQRLDVAAILSAAGLHKFNGSFNINFDIQGVYGTVLQAAGSVDQTNTYVFEVNARGIGVSGSRSLPYWSTGSGDDTMVTIWNPADEAQDFIFKLFFTGGQYEFPIHLGARATQTLNISEVIQSQFPDAEGNIIPASVHEGSAVISGSLADNQHVLFAADLGIYNVRKAICGAPNCTTCNGITATAVAANPFAVAVSGQTQLAFTGTWNTGAQFDYSTSSNWSSNNTPVATVQTGLTKGVSPGSATVTAQLASAEPEYVAQMCSPTTPVCPNGTNSGNSPGNVNPTVTISGPQNIPMLKSGTQGSDSITLTANPNPAGGTYSWTASSGGANITILNATSQSAIIQSVAVGAYTVQVTYTVNSKTATASSSGKVQQPGSLSAITNSTPTFNCGSTGLPSYNTLDRLIQYQVLDTSGAPIPASNMTAAEAFSPVSNSCGVPYPAATTGSTLSNGYFPGPDTLQLCSQACLPAGNNGAPVGSCTMKVGQTWSVNGYPVKNDTITYTCPGPPTGAP